MLTLALARRGVGARTIDRLPKAGDTSKAITLHARTLEIIECIDKRLVTRFLERGAAALEARLREWFAL